MTDFNKIKKGLLLSGALLAAGEAHSFAFYNDLDVHSYQVSIEGGSDFSQTVTPGGSQACHWSDTGCNPSGAQNGLLTANLNIGALDFSCRINLQAGGWVRVRDNDGYLQCHSYDTNGVTRDVNPVQVSDSSRSVRFLATADPQYDNGNHTRNAVADETLSVMAGMIKSSDDIRGLLVAGDLTQNSRKDEREWFESATWRIRDYLYEGMGNHDDMDPNFWQRLACPLLSYCVSPQDIMTSINHPRNNVLQKEQYNGGLYSWDWQDVHVLQLGSFIANEPAGNHSDIDPYQSLEFMKQDLARNVGTSGRPVILMSHYGFDGFSNGWWSEDQRRKMWEAIDGYNVVAIFSGHSHRGPYDQWHFTVNRPAGTSKGPDSVLNVVAGAALFKAFVDVEIEGDTMTVHRMTYDDNKAPVLVGSHSLSLNSSYERSEASVRFQSLMDNRCLSAATDPASLFGATLYKASKGITAQVPGHLALLKDCAASDKWAFEKDTGRLRHLASGQCLASAGGYQVAEMADCSDSSAQKWVLVR